MKRLKQILPLLLAAVVSVAVLSSCKETNADRLEKMRGALDGGHVLFLFYEMIARRKPSDKFMEYAQMTGMILLFGLLIWANFNDILRFFF